MIAVMVGKDVLEMRPLGTEVGIAGQFALWHPHKKAIWTTSGYGIQEISFGKPTRKVTSDTVDMGYLTAAAFYWDSVAKTVAFATIKGFSSNDKPRIFHLVGKKLVEQEVEGGANCCNTDEIIWAPNCQRLLHINSQRGTEGESDSVRVFELDPEDRRWRPLVDQPSTLSSTFDLYAGYDAARDLVVVLDQHGHCEGFDGKQWHLLPEHPTGGWTPAHFTQSSESGRLVMLHTERSTTPASLLWKLGEDEWVQKDTAGLLPNGGMTYNFDSGICHPDLGTLFGFGRFSAIEPMYAWIRYDGERLVPYGSPLPPKGAIVAHGHRVMAHTAASSYHFRLDDFETAITQFGDDDEWHLVPGARTGFLGMFATRRGLLGVDVEGAIVELNDGSRGSWMRICEPPKGFSPRAAAAVAWDHQDEVLHVVGGKPFSGRFPADYHRWSRETGWEELRPKGKTPAFMGMSATFDSRRRVLVVTGGHNKGRKANPDTYELVDGKWERYPSEFEGGTPFSSYGSSPQAGFDPASGHIVLLGEEAVWIYGGAGRWHRLTVFPKDARIDSSTWDAETREVVALSNQRVLRGSLAPSLDGFAPTPALTATVSEPVKPSSRQPVRYLRCDDDGSDKYWFASLETKTVIVRWGKRGAKESRKTFEYPNKAAAEKAYDKKVSEKLNKGYWDAPEGEKAATIVGMKSYYWKLGKSGQDWCSGVGPAEVAAPRCAECGEPMQHLVTLHAHPERLPLTEHLGLSVYMCGGDGACETYEVTGGANAVVLLEDAPSRPAKLPRGTPKPRSIQYVERFEADPEGDDAVDLELKDKSAGYPVWYQSDATPHCPECKKAMHFVAQFNEHEFANFGGDGIGYVFVCSEEHAGAFLWQCG